MFIKKLQNKRGQTGEAITWIVATLIIIVILLISISIANFMGNNKKFDYSKRVDVLASKSLFAYLLTEEFEEDKIIYEKIKEVGNFTKFNGELAVSIFEQFYNEDYWLVWSAIYSKPNRITHNTYFPKPPPCGSGIWDEIQLEENKYILITLTKHC